MLKRNSKNVQSLIHSPACTANLVPIKSENWLAI